MEDKNNDMRDDNLNDPIEAEGFSENVDDLSAIPETSEEGGEDEATLKLQSELAEQKDKYVRLFAEFDNFKRRTFKENMELRQTAGKEIITSLLEVLDDMDRAEQQMEESKEENSMQAGTILIFNKFRKILESKGLKQIETLHTEFDVEKDEAISEIPVDDKKLKGKVVAEMQKGYFLNDKLIRFAKVVVGK